MKLRLGIKLITQVEPLVDEAEQKRSQLEEKIGDAGTASLRENDIRQILSELLQSAAELLRKRNPVNKSEAGKNHS